MGSVFAFLPDFLPRMLIDLLSWVLGTSRDEPRRPGTDTGNKQRQRQPPRGGIRSMGLTSKSRRTTLTACVGGVLGAATLASAGPSQYVFEMSRAVQTDWNTSDPRDLVIVDIYMEFENATDFLQAVYGTFRECPVH